MIVIVYWVVENNLVYFAQKRRLICDCDSFLGQCGSTTSPHFEGGCNVDVLWSNVDFHISNVNKCRYIVGQHNGNLR